jgi:subtilase family serine protease
MRTTLPVTLAVALAAALAPAATSWAVDYGPISHKGLKSAGPASTSLKLPLQLGLKVDQSDIADAVKAASDPSSGKYGKYPSLSKFQSSYGASKSKRNAVKQAFAKQNVSASVDVTHLRVGATTSIGKAQKLFGTKWKLYSTGGSNQLVALPVNTPQLPKGIKGNVDTVAGMRLVVSARPPAGSSRARPRRVAQTGGPPYLGGTPRRTGTPGPSCVPSQFPDAATATAGLFPGQITTAYGIAALQAAGLRGQDARVAIVGEAPTVGSDLSTFRSCFGYQGTGLKTHGAGSIQPILESSLDTMVVAMVAPQLDRFDLWVHPISEDDDDGDVLGFLHLLAQPLQATKNGTPLPDVISVSYGVCESTVSDDTASRKLAERQLKATAALGVSVVVAAGDTGSSACARGIPPAQLTAAEKGAQVSWPASSSWVLAVGGTNVTLSAGNAIAATGTWNDTIYPFPYTATAGGGGGSSTFVSRPWWQPAQSFATAGKRMVPDVAAFADASPGYAIVCSGGVQGCPGGGQAIAYVGGTSASTPLVAGMIALWAQQARAAGLARPGFVPPLLYGLARDTPQAFVDVTLGGNALFGGSCCPARPGYDLATGWGSPLANVVAGLLPRPG